MLEASHSKPTEELTEMVWQSLLLRDITLECGWLQQAREYSRSLRGAEGMFLGGGYRPPGQAWQTVRLTAQEVME